MTDRDRFAAAALTGLLSNVQRYQNEPLTRQAFEIADFMLRERERTNHDAVPAAIARTDADRNRTDKAALRPGKGAGNTCVTEPMPKEKRAEVSDAEPVAWAVVSDSTGQIDCEFVYPDEATAGDVALDSNGGVVPLYRHPQPTLTDAEREAVEQAIDAANGMGQAEPWTMRTLRGLLERLGGGR